MKNRKTRKVFCATDFSGSSLLVIRYPLVKITITQVRSHSNDLDPKEKDKAQKKSINLLNGILKYFITSVLVIFTSVLLTFFFAIQSFVSFRFCALNQERLLELPAKSISCLEYREGSLCESNPSSPKIVSCKRDRKSLDFRRMEIWIEKDSICFMIFDSYIEYYKSVLYRKTILITFTTTTGKTLAKTMLREIWFHLIFSNLRLKLQDMSQSLSIDSFLFAPITNCQDKKKDSKNPFENISVRSFLIGTEEFSDKEKKTDLSGKKND